MKTFPVHCQTLQLQSVSNGGTKRFTFSRSAMVPFNQTLHTSRTATSFMHTCVSQFLMSHPTLIIGEVDGAVVVVVFIDCIPLCANLQIKVSLRVACRDRQTGRQTQTFPNPRRETPSWRLSCQCKCMLRYVFVYL